MSGSNCAGEGVRSGMESLSCSIRRTRWCRPVSIEGVRLTRALTESQKVGGWSSHHKQLMGTLSRSRMWTRASALRTMCLC